MPASLLIIVVLLLLMWLLLIRPQRRRQTVQNQLLANLQEGDEVVTAGGIYGRIEEVDEADVVLEIAPGTSVRLAKHAIAGVLNEEDEEEEVDERELDADSAEPAEAAETPALDASTPDRPG
jgi:preprotein translocase subunit YajC